MRSGVKAVVTTQIGADVNRSGSLEQILRREGLSPKVKRSEEESVEYVSQTCDVV